MHAPHLLGKSLFKIDREIQKVVLGPNNSLYYFFPSLPECV